jgi:polysaccharide biosynthesis/export protein
MNMHGSPACWPHGRSLESAACLAGDTPPRTHQDLGKGGTAVTALLGFGGAWKAAARAACSTLACAGVLCACTTELVTTNKVPVQVEVLNAARRFELVYEVRPGDQLEIFMQRHNDLSRKVTVRPDGFISLPIIDEVKASGKSPRELAEELKKLYTTRLRDPEVNVIVLNPPEPMVYVVGQVGAPKAVPLRQAGTLAQAIVQAGDATKLAAAGSISVIRLNASGQMEAHVLDTHGRDASQPEVYMAMAAVPLKTNDLIVVPESQRSQIMRVLQDTSTALVPILNLMILKEIAITP